MDTGASSGAPDSRTAPPPTPLPPPTLAPRRTPTPTPTPPPPQLIPHAAPDAPPLQQSPARRQAPCPLLWCLLIGASALACLPTDMWHQAQETRKAPAWHAGPAASSAMIALLMILGAGATPRAMSAPVSAHVAALNLTTHHSTHSCPIQAALPARTEPRAGSTPAPRPLQPRPQPADPTPVDSSAGVQRARWSLASVVAIAALLLARPCLTSAADHHHGSHQRPHQRRGDGTVGAASTTAARGSAHGAPAAGASDQPLPVYPHYRAEESDGLVVTARAAQAHNQHAARGGAHARQTAARWSADRAGSRRRACSTCITTSAQITTSPQSRSPESSRR